MELKEPLRSGGVSDAAELTSLTRYITILANKYPNPVTYRELASKARVSKAAISKVRDRLQSICDVKTLAYRRKLVLRTDATTFIRILVAFFTASTPGPLLRTPYVRALWVKYVLDVYRKTSK